MLSLRTDTPGLAATNAFDKASRSQATSATRLSTGYRINTAMDDAAGLQIATRLSAQVAGTRTALRNIQNGISLMQAADGVADGMGTIFGRMHDLALQAADASSTQEDKAALQAEFTELFMQAWEVVTTKYNGQYLMANIGEPGSLGLSLDLQIGAESENVLHVDWLDAISGVGAGLKYSYPGTLETMLTENASQAVQDTAEAIDAIAGARSEFGAIANRLESAYRTASNLIVNTVSAQGRIRDTDFATESAESVAAQMLMQSSSAMLKQSGSVKQLAMSLIQ